MPREPAGAEYNGYRDRRCAAGISRPHFAPLPQLHHLPPEDSRQPHRQEPAAMRILGLLLLIASASGLLAQTPPAVTQTAPAPAAPPAAEATPVPTVQPVLSGYIDLGYRWVTGVG